MAAGSAARHVLDSYRCALAIAGYAPAFVDCAHCGRPPVTATGEPRPPPLVQPVDGRCALLTCRIPVPLRPRRRPWCCWAPCSPATGRVGAADPAHVREANGLVAAFAVAAGARSPVAGVRRALSRPATPALPASPDRLTPVSRSSRRTRSAAPTPARAAPLPPTPHPSGARPPALPPELVPHHVAIVMDGNGRWARSAACPTQGSSRGRVSLFDVVEGAIEIGVKAVSAYAFSTENWSRSPDEVKFLMGFNRDVVRRRREEMHERGIRVRWAGGRSCEVGHRRAAHDRGADETTTS